MNSWVGFVKPLITHRICEFWCKILQMHRTCEFLYMVWKNSTKRTEIVNFWIGFVQNPLTNRNCKFLYRVCKNSTDAYRNFKFLCWVWKIKTWPTHRNCELYYRVCKWIHKRDLNLQKSKNRGHTFSTKNSKSIILE